MPGRVLPFRSRETGTIGHRVLTDGDITRLYADTPAVHLTSHTRAHRRWILLVLGLIVGIVVASFLLVEHDGPVPIEAPVAAPPGPAAVASTMSWRSMQGVEFPVSSSEGPRNFTPTLSSGFSDSDLGAALAATHIVYRASSAPGPVTFEPALAQQIAGPGGPQLAETVRADYREAIGQFGLEDGAPLPDGVATFVGYRVSSLPDGNRSVQIVEQAPDANGLLQPFAFDVVVTRAQDAAGVDDWRVVAPTGGTWSAAFTQLASVPGDIIQFDRPAALAGGSGF